MPTKITTDNDFTDKVRSCVPPDLDPYLCSALFPCLKNNKFVGLHNTKELVDIVQGYFSGCTRKLTVMSVQGTTDKFKSAIALDVSSEDEFKNVFKLYMCNTDETLIYKKVRSSHLFIYLLYIFPALYTSTVIVYLLYIYVYTFF